MNRKVNDRGGRLHQRLASGVADAPLVEEFYLRALGRMPAAGEAVFWSSALKGADSRAEREALAEDFVWGLLNCREFQTNH